MRISLLFRPFAMLLGFLISLQACADAYLTDAAGQKLRLKTQANRIISLAPFVTELLYAIGAGEKIVGTVEYSDYPPKARNIPRIGRYNAIDEEQVIVMAPDLVIAWKTGTPSAITDRLSKMGIPVFFLEPSTLDDVRKSMLLLGRITGRQTQAGEAARAFEETLDHLRVRFSGRPVITVFYQIWDKPLMSIGGRQVVSDMLNLCGGKNVFSEVRKIAFPVTVESVIRENPRVIIVAGRKEITRTWSEGWKQWPYIEAVKDNNIFIVDPDLMRHTPRILKGVTQLCEALDQARKNSAGP